MKKYFSLVEARVRDAADILTQMPQNQSQRPPPRVLKLLEDAEEAIKAQYKRMNDTLEAVANKVVDDIDPIPKDEPKESREGPYGRARDVTIITSSLLRTLPMLVKILHTLPMLTNCVPCPLNIAKYML